MDEKTENNISNNEKKYTKSRFLASKTYENRKDLLNALLDDTKEYTKEDVDKFIDGYLKRRVK